MKISFVFPPAWSPAAPSYGMAILGATCRRAGHEFFGFDLNIDFYRAVDEALRPLWQDDKAVSWYTQTFVDQLIADHATFLGAYADRVLAPRPDLLAVSVQTASSLFGLAFARLVRERAPGIFILFGGPDCFPSERGLSVLNSDWVNAICTGEGDEALPAYLEQLADNGMQPVEMNGFCHRREDGTIFDGGQPGPVMNLDGLPFADFSGIDFNQYTINNRIAMMTSRGCILRCSFCSEGENFLRYRYRSPDSLIEEVAQHVAMLRKVSGIRPHIHFSDSLINGRPEALEGFCRMVLERNLDFTWGGMALLRKEMTHDLLSLMRRAGWIEVMWGMESGSHATLKLMRKKLFDPDLAERIVKDAHGLGVDQCTNIIVGFPGETDEQFAETVTFVRRIHPYFRSIGLPMMEIRRNSHVYAAPDRYNVLDKDNTVEWQTQDGSNNIQVRLARRQILADIVQTKIFEQGRYNDLEIAQGAPPTERFSVATIKRALKKFMALGTQESH